MTYAQSAEEERVAAHQCAQGYSSINCNGRRVLTTWLPWKIWYEWEPASCIESRTLGTSLPKQC